MEQLNFWQRFKKYCLLISWFFGGAVYFLLAVAVLNTLLFTLLGVALPILIILIISLAIILNFGNSFRKTLLTLSALNEIGWKRHFTVKNLLINGLIAFPPASIIVTILIGILIELEELLGIKLVGSPMADLLGLLMIIILVSILFGFIYSAGELRERIKIMRNKKQL